MSIPKTKLTEAVSIANSVIAALLGTLTGPPTAAGAQLAWLCGDLTANSAEELNWPTYPIPFWADLVNCFEQARLAGATYQAMDLVRSMAADYTPAGNAGIAVANFATRMALIEQANILAAMTFVSRPQIDTYLDTINANFFAAENIAADNMDNVSYTALIRVHGAVVNDLSTRAIPLPEIVGMTFPTRLPALTMAQRIYQDPSQTDALVSMNGIVHPLFCPQTIEVLSI